MFGLFLNRRGPSWRCRLERKVDVLMSSFDDLKSALDAATTKVAAIRTDTATLLAKITELQSNPPSGMTSEQQASLDQAVTTAQGLVASLGTIDDEVNPAPAPSPAPAPAEPPAAPAPSAAPGA